MYPDYLVHFNPNHDPKTGQFAPGAGGPTSNKIGARLKKTDLLNLDGPNAWRDFDNKTGNYSRLKAAADTGMKAMAKCGDKEPLEEGWDDWFLFEDQTFGMPQIADLANKGKTKDEIKQIIKDCYDYMNETARYYDADIPGVWYLYEWENSNQYYTVDGEKYIDACIEAAKENRQVKHSGVAKFGNYLCHYNKNHSPKNGQFTSGDGDGDGVSNDHANRSKKSGMPSSVKNGIAAKLQYDFGSVGGWQDEDKDIDLKRIFDNADDAELVYLAVLDRTAEEVQKRYSGLNKADIEDLIIRYSDEIFAEGYRD